MNILSMLFGGGNIQNLSASEYKEQFLDTKQAHTLVDVRTVAEFKSGHPAKAINIPLDQLSQKLSKIPKDKPVICVCASGSRSAAAASLLSREGYETVYNLSGGFTRWQMAKLPSER